LKQVSLWRAHLPTVVPHYAVKSNNDTRLLRWLQDTGSVGFDCASPGEIRQALKAGASPTRIVYANPCKSPDDIHAATQLGAFTTVVDSPEEVQKLLEAKWSGAILIRLKVPDAGSAQPFSRKFGMPVAWIPEMMEILRSTPIRLKGWSFHVGSLCTTPDQFSKAIEVCATASDLAKIHADVIDIGGGFLPDEASFAAAAAEIRGAQRWFSPQTSWIAEPGRFMSAPVVTLRVNVIGVKARHDRSGWIYTLDESVYGSFSNIPFDGQIPVYQLMAPDAADRPKVRATLFGRTCDSADCLASDIEVPELRVGDVLEVPNMGAYTSVSASYFNGFGKPKRKYA
jgi:ornithine decarboxylase